MTALVGRSFVHPLFDYLLIGGGLSLVVTAWVLVTPNYGEVVGFTVLAWLILVSNSAHFAASTVRLYTKRGTWEQLPFLTLAFPLVSLAVVTVCIAFPGTLGRHLQALNLTWSPFHYAAQAYGLAIVYAYRSGCRLAPADKRLLYWTAMLPFFFTFISGMGVGLDWLAPASVLALPPVETTLGFLSRSLPWISVAAVTLLFAKIWASQSGPLPLISVLMLVTNGVWWFVLDPMGAFTWATIFHGLQYLAIATIFHVRDRTAQEGNRQGVLYHAAWFYGACLLLGYALFYCLPWGYEAAGFGLLESVALVVAAINVHHFIVDAFIWRIAKDGANRQIVQEGTAIAA